MSRKALSTSSAQQQGQIHQDISIHFYCANAMEATELYQHATNFFLYLIPRGLKIFKPMLLEVMKKRRQKDENNDTNASLTVLTYMSPLPGETFEKRELCQVEHQPGAAWPLYLYHLKYSEEDE